MRSIFLKLLLFILIPVSLYSQYYRGAELRTLDSFLYGRFEVCYKPANGDGLVASFFTYNDLNPITPWNEIDIEILGRYTNILDFVTITNGQDTHKSNQLVDFDPHLDFNIYTIEWTPDYVAWFVNDKEVFRQTQDHIDLLVEPQKIMMNIWNPLFSDWVGVWDERILPRFSYYDYVSYASYTPDSGNVGTDYNFTSEWQDDFNYFDSTRWEKKDNHIWPGNQALLIEENIVFKDGYMILCLTDEDNIGYVDLNPPAALWARAESGNKIIIRFSEELDRTSAENLSNYFISGVDLLSAHLLEDLRTVELSSVQLDYENLGNIVVKGIIDDTEKPNKLLGQVLNIFVPEYLSFPLKINVGGEESMDFLSDQRWAEDKLYGHEDGSYRSVNEDIADTDLDSIYASYLCRLVSYKVRLTDGIYRIKMMFSESYYEEPEKRVFDIYVEGDKVVQNLDIYATAGRNAAYDLIFENITVSDGILNINFSPVHFGDGNYEDRGALLNGLAIERTGGTGIEHGSRALPLKYVLHQNYPNPFNPCTRIQYDLLEDSDVTLKIYNIAGKEVCVLVDSHLNAGSHNIMWDGRDSNGTSLPSGLYVYQIKAGNYMKSMKMIMVK